MRLIEHAFSVVRRLGPVGLLLSCLTLTGCNAELTSEQEPDGSGDASDAVPVSSVNDAMLKCMDSKGWTGTMKLDGTIGFGTVPIEQDGAFQIAYDKCVDKTGWGDLARLTADQRLAMYELEVEEFECLKQRGLTPPEPPTEQTYVDTFATAQQYYAGATLELTGAEIQACPPPTWFMNW